jgi:hypothetical protein
MHEQLVAESLDQVDIALDDRAVCRAAGRCSGRNPMMTFRPLWEASAGRASVT